MKSFFSIALILAVLNPFCCCWTAGAEEVAAPPTHSCCGAGARDDGPAKKEHHNPEDCPHQHWMKTQHVDAEVKAQAPVLLDLHMVLPDLEYVLHEGYGLSALELDAFVSSIGRRSLSIVQMYCVRLL